MNAQESAPGPTVPTADLNDRRASVRARLDESARAPGRNLLLDFFRGWALLTIFINHIPFNTWSAYTPSRFGLSDAAEIFVFLSGFASAIAFGRSFRVAGLGVGSAQVLLRCGQIYGAHLGLFFALTAICVVGNALWIEPDYIARLNLGYFFEQTPDAVLGLVTLTYVPNYFDILPMYLVVLLWLPLFWALSRIHPGAALGASLGVYLAMWLFGLALPADPLSARPWFFNPFGWQLLFFLGFAFGSGWLRVPRPRPWLTVLALAGVCVAVPIVHAPIYQGSAFWGEVRTALEPLLDKTQLGPLRIVHFLCLAYLVVGLLRPREDWPRRPLPGLIATAGQHSLSIFLFGMALSYIGGMVLDRLGQGAAALVLVNLGGIALLLLTARGLEWLGLKPWKRAARMDDEAGADGGRRLAPARGVRPGWAWAGHLVLAAGVVSLAIAPAMLVRKVNDLGETTAARLRGSPTGTAAPGEATDYLMTPVRSMAVSIRARLQPAERAPGPHHPEPDRVVGDTEGLALIRASLATAPDARQRVTRPPAGAAKAVKVRQPAAGGKGSRAVRATCVPGTASAGPRATPCTLRKSALRKTAIRKTALRNSR